MTPLAFPARPPARAALLTGLLLAFGLAASPALADPNGVWTRSDGTSRVRIAACGNALCGTITWLKDPNSPAKVGQRVFFDMVPAGQNTWSGKAFNPEDGRTYSGTMSLSGNSLTTRGCVLGGVICRSVNWTRGG